MLKRIFILLMPGVLQVAAQNPSNITFPSPTAVPPYLSTDSYSRAATSINLQPGFVYGAISGSLTNLLNLNLSSYPPYVNNNYQDPGTTPNYIIKNPALEAAVTPGVFQIDAMGGFHYNIPVVCSPGTAGIEPKLSIGYNSNGSNNWLGKGFDLEGISMIRRTGKSVFFDGLNGGVKFNSSDVFEMDGTRLLIRSGTYGAAGATYKTPVENYHTIVSNGSAGSSGPQYFTVATPEGLFMEYGNTGDSRSMDAGNTEIFAWYINKVYDAFGNYMTYSYSNSGGELLISEINYTGNAAAGLSPYNTIKFEYMDRSDDISFYAAGKEFKRSHLLKSITCLALNNALTRKYCFEYQYQLASLLSKITEVDAAGNTLNPTYFEWTEATQPLSHTGCGNITPSSPGAGTVPQYGISIPVDFTGDGRKDLLLLRNDLSFDALVKINVPGGPCAPGYDAPLTFTTTGALLSIAGTTVEYITNFVFDEDDDDKEEVFVIYATPLLNTYTYFITKIKQVNGNYVVSPEAGGILPQNLFVDSWHALNFSNAFYSGINRSTYFYAKEDLSGDNVRDVLAVTQNTLFFFPTGAPAITMNATNIIKTALGDFDGDGVPDIYTIKSMIPNAPPYLCEVYKYDPGTNALVSMAGTVIHTGINPYLSGWASYNNSAVLNNYANACKSIDFGDFNGDGKMDLMYVNYLNASNGNVHVLRSNGLTFLADPSPLPVPLALNGWEASFSAGDINADGYTDLLTSSYDNTNKISHFGYYPGAGNFFPGLAGAYSYYDEHLGAMADFNGDGLPDYLHQSSFFSFKIGFTAYAQPNKKMVSRIFNLKNELTVNYEYLPGNAKGYYSENCVLNTDPAFDHKKPAMFVTTGTVDNEVNYRYKYSGCVSHRLGKGFLGFERIDTEDGTKTFTGQPTNFKRNFSTSTFDPASDEVVSTETTSDFMAPGSPAASYSKTDLTYVATGTNRYLSSQSTTGKDYLSSTFNVQTTTYDNSSGGQVLNTANTHLTWLGQQPILSVQQAYLYQGFTINGHTHYKGKKVTEDRSANSLTSTYVTDLSYNGAAQLIKTVKNSNHTSLAVTTDYSSFDLFGKALQTTVSAPDLAQPRSSLVQYDNTGRFITQTTDAMGHLAQAHYEPVYGNLVQSTGISGLASTFVYDGLGRLVKSTSPTGAATTSKYEWYLYTWGGFSPQSCYALKVTTNDEAGGSAISYHDREDRVVKTESSGFGGATVITENEYSNRGLLTMSKAPHYTGQSVVLRNEYAYDDFDRPRSSSVYNNSNVYQTSTSYGYNAPSTNAAYSKGSCTVTTPSGSGAATLKKVTQNNEAGQVDKVINYTNTSAQHQAAYTYNQHGQPTQMVTSFPGGTGGAATGFGYDALGRRNSLSDPSSGAHTYTYNSLGELLREVKPNGDYTFTYDALGRMTTRTGSGLGAYAYDYVSSGNGLGSLKKITGPVALSEYAYDAFGRTIEKKESLGAGSSARQFISRYSYDKYDRLLDYTGPGNFKTSNDYDASGTLVKIRNNTTTLWELTGMKAPGLVESYKNSAGVTTQLTYDGGLNLAQTDLGSTLSQSFSISGATSNLLNRSSQSAGVSNNEGFEYDEFDRLVKTTCQDSSNTTQTKHSFSYQPNGNLSFKTDCGTYAYGNSSSPYQVTSVSGYLNPLNVQHNDLDKVSQITDNAAGKQLDLVYGNDGERIRMEYRLNSQLQYTRYYQNHFDREETPGSYREWSYVLAPTGIAAVYFNNNDTARLLNVSPDALGSPVMLSNGSGAVVEEQSFDAWGRRRNPADWSYAGIPAVTRMIRGYTGHEQLDEVGLINMNGRVYDPLLGRFVQPDPVVQDAGDLQNLNRYSYVLNNPLRYTDPSGYRYSGPVGGATMADPVTGGSQNFSDVSMYVDGMKVEGGVAGLMGGAGGLGLETSASYGVWTGNGPTERSFNRINPIDPLLPGCFASILSNPYMQAKIHSLNSPSGGGIEVGAMKAGMALLSDGISGIKSLFSAQTYQNIGSFWVNALDHDMESMDWDRWGNNVENTKNFVRNIPALAKNATLEDWSFGITYTGLSILGTRGLGSVGGVFRVGGAVGPLKNWLRFGDSRSLAGGFLTKGFRWGAGGDYWKNIGNPWLRQLNRDFRKTKIPIDSWRTRDPGHWHWYKLDDK